MPIKPESSYTESLKRLTIKLLGIIITGGLIVTDADLSRLKTDSGFKYSEILYLRALARIRILAITGAGPGFEAVSDEKPVRNPERILLELYLIL